MLTIETVGSQDICFKFTDALAKSKCVFHLKFANVSNDFTSSPHPQKYQKVKKKGPNALPIGI